MAFWDRWFDWKSPDDPKPRLEPKPRPASAEPPLPEFPLPLQRCRGTFIDARLPQLRRQAAQRGETLIVLGDDDDVRTLKQVYESAEATKEEILTAASQLNVDEWLAKQVEADPEWYECEPGEWPMRDERNRSMTAHLIPGTNRPKPNVYLATLPTARSWETPAYLRFGHWNDCPQPHVHVAMAKRWNERFGAELIAATGDIVEFEVVRPLMDREAAMRLAREQFVYCADIVQQGTETLECLAASLLRGKCWFFWWD